MTIDYEAGRRMVLEAAKEGRAVLVPAGADRWDVAMIEIDGEPFGQMSTFGHLVREKSNGTRFGRVELIPNYRIDR